MITIIMHTGVAEMSRSGKSRVEIPYRAGLTVASVVLDEGLSAEQSELLMVMINSEHAEIESPLRDGDVVDLILPIAGGARLHCAVGPECGIVGGARHV